MSDEQEQPKPSPSRSLRSVGDALGGWARRVGELVAEVSGTPSIPDELREPLQQARTLRLSGQLAQAQAILRGQIEAHQDQPHLRYALGLGFVHDLVTGGRPLRPLADVIASLQDALGPAPRQLLQGAHDLYDGRPEHALDALRRAARHLAEVPKRDAQETRLLVHLLAGLAQLRRGEQDRALRDLHKARTQLPPELGTPLRHVLLGHGVALLLASATRRPTTSTTPWPASCGCGCSPPRATSSEPRRCSRRSATTPATTRRACGWA